MKSNDPPSGQELPRHIRTRIVEAMSDMRVVMIAGPRQSGKTTVARSFATERRPYFSLDDIGIRRAAEVDPTGFIRDLDAAVIDEIQRAPELLLEIKAAVDRNRKPGQFLITGSADLATLPTVSDSLAGRMETISLLPFSQSELLQQPNSRFLENAFEGSFVRSQKPTIWGETLIATALRGGYPEPALWKMPARRAAWHRTYIRQILERDAPSVAEFEHSDRLTKLLPILAEHSGQLTNFASLASAVGLTNPTTQKYASIFERLYLSRSILPWHSNKLSRLVKAPKIHFLDSGLLAALRRDSIESLRANKTRFGAILESFVFSELLKLSELTGDPVSINHFRDKDQAEVDFVLEDPRGRIVGIEVKSHATVSLNDFAGLRKLSAAAGDRFIRGFVLHDGMQSLPFGDKLQASPISILWDA